MDLKNYMNKDLIEEKLYQVKDQFNHKVSFNTRKQNTPI